MNRHEQNQRIATVGLRPWSMLLATCTLIYVVLHFVLGTAAFAQDALKGNLRIATIERPPFSMIENDEAAGFSVELMRHIAAANNYTVDFTYFGSFPDMLAAVESNEYDAAIANISITRDREAAMDFSQPIFDSGLQIMVHETPGSVSLLRTLLNWELALVMVLSFSGLFACGILMWVFERRKQPYFDRELGEALFPSFWWALNLVVNGGFEERQPRSLPGRIFAVLLVVSSLFIVSIFVAHITAAMTIEAINSSVNSIQDLDGRRVATTEESTTSRFLDSRGIGHATYDTFGGLIEAFEEGDLDAVVFDGPLLAYYLRSHPRTHGYLVDVVFQPETYGIALPSGSMLREELNVEILEMGETGAYDALKAKWFGQSR